MAGWKESLYAKSPVAFQNAAISAYGYYWKARRFGGVFDANYQAFHERESFSVSQWRDYVTIELRRLLVHAYQTVPFYRERYTASGISLERLKTFEIEMLPQLPMLEKSALRSEGTTRLLSSARERGGQFYASSGSTGTPTSILYSFPMHQRQAAAYEARVRNWAGVDRFMPRAMIGGRRVVPQGTGRPPYYRFNIAERQLYMSAYHISRATAKDYLRGLVQHGSQYMVGYAMSNYILARFFQEEGLAAPEMKAVLTSSEKLTSQMRGLFSDVYKCKTFDGWSGVENCGLISENEHGQLLVSPDVGWIEVLDIHGNPAAPGEEGEVVCTGFLNYDQPLIRYRIGDAVRLSDEKAACGRNMPVIKEIVGRLEDVVVGRDGREMVRFHGIFTNLATVVEAQVVQHDYDKFEIIVVTSGRFADEDKVSIRSRMKSQLGTIEISFREVPEIPRGNNGKFKAVISHVKDRR